MDLIRLIVGLVVVGVIASILGLGGVAGFAFDGAWLIFGLLILFALFGIGWLIFSSFRS